MATRTPARAVYGWQKHHEQTAWGVFDMEDGSRHVCPADAETLLATPPHILTSACSCNPAVEQKLTAPGRHFPGPIWIHEPIQ